MNHAIELKGVTKRFGDFGAVNGVDLAVPQAQRCALLGPNGAGKTTLLNLISGRLSLSDGEIRLKGHDVSRASARRRAQLGVGRSFQKTNIFPQLTLLENVRLGVQNREGRRNWNPWRAADGDAALNETAARWLRQVNIRRSHDARASALSYGEQRQLELAITLATEPQIVLLDEPTAGMSHSETAVILELMAKLLEGLTVVIVEHDLSVVDRIAHRVVVMERGGVICDGTPAEVKADTRVQSAYLKGAHRA
ncbi:ABC transporter ATP-binding protein [Ramlibacter henchirensis]|uniref:ABC transporter ATP-binding protein n=1 Tax=Ramlibacter henchirensis TaxID=204072 RepID=A0A4Z0BU39_9BURK|nr:ABC transporter ATP-binding protein [Ramlibacter henchirensis]TFZ02837.1 ABC transporter ATP-binding protein [Ramlibacter henchirensis]